MQCSAVSLILLTFIYLNVNTLFILLFQTSSKIFESFYNTEGRRNHQNWMTLSGSHSNKSFKRWSTNGLITFMPKLFQYYLFYFPIANIYLHTSCFICFDYNKCQITEGGKKGYERTEDEQAFSRSRINTKICSFSWCRWLS